MNRPFDKLRDLNLRNTGLSPFLMRSMRLFSSSKNFESTFLKLFLMNFQSLTAFYGIVFVIWFGKSIPNI